MLIPRGCRVRKVRLRAPTAALVQRGALLLEDALHVATVPEMAGRLLVVRSLALGSFRSRGSSATLALQIEARLRELVPSMVHAEDPAAATRPVVYFRSDVEPLVCLAGRLGRQQDVSAWFWPLAVPGFQPTQPREDALRAVLKAAIGTAAGPMAAVALLQNLLLHGGADAMLGALRYTEGPALLRGCGWSVPSGFTQSPAGVAVPAAADSLRWAPLLSRWATSWGHADARSIWLAAVALVDQRPIRLVDRFLIVRAQRLLQACAAVAPAVRAPAGEHGSTDFAHLGLQAPSHQGSAPVPIPQVPLSVPTAPASPVATPPQAQEAASGHGTLRSVSATGTLLANPWPASRTPTLLPPASQETPPGDPHVSSDPSASPTTKPAANNPAAAPAAVEFSAKRLVLGGAPTIRQELGRPTELAGLFFLLPVLSRLQISAVLHGNPEWVELDLPRHILYHVARYLRAPSKDPVLDAIAPADPPGPELTPLAELWLTELRSYCARLVRRSLRNIVRRPGRVATTRTHLDVFLAQEQADPRVRRAGLDLDPGWLPWFGQVVHFHYLPPEDHAE